MTRWLITLTAALLLPCTNGFQVGGDPPNWKPTSTRSKKPQSDVSAQTETPKATVPLRRATEHKSWGVDKDHSNEYWFDKRIHTLGNVGLGGGLHAAVAPLSTKLIDFLAYDGVDLRGKVAEELKRRVTKRNARILDLCCGVGTSTRSLHKAFPHAETIIGVDTSPEMVSMACFLTQHLGLFQPLLQSWNLQLATLTTTMKEQGKKMQTAAQAPCRPAVYLQGNAEDTRLDTKSFDLVTIMYAFHEAPKDGRQRILHEARRVLRPGGTLAIVDISDEYTPTESMLAGEPYVLEYQQNIHKQLQTLKGFVTPTYKTLIPGHVGIWLLKKKDPSTATM